MKKYWLLIFFIGFTVFGRNVLAIANVASVVATSQIYTHLDKRVSLDGNNNKGTHLSFNFQDGTMCSVDPWMDNTIHFYNQGITTHDHSNLASPSIFVGDCQKITVKQFDKVIYVIPVPRFDHISSYFTYKGHSIGFILNKEKTVGVIYPLPLPDNPSDLQEKNIIDWFELTDTKENIGE